MIFNPNTATEETKEILRDTFDWWDALHDSIQRIASQMFDKKPIAILIPAKPRKQIKEHAGEYIDKLG